MNNTQRPTPSALDVKDRVCAAIARALGVPNEVVRVTSRREDHEKWDSLGHLDIVMEVESEFGCSFTLDETMQFGGVEDIVRSIVSKGIA